MFGTVSHEIEADVPASAAWELYGTLQLSKLIGKELPHVLHKIEVVEGDGGAGTILKLTFPPGTHVFTTYKEKFTKIDNEKRVKEVDAFEGGYLDLGFNLYRIRIEIKENEKGGTGKSCITKTTIEYDVKEDAAANASLVSIQPFVEIMEVANNFLMQSHKKLKRTCT